MRFCKRYATQRLSGIYYLSARGLNEVKDALRRVRDRNSMRAARAGHQDAPHSIKIARMAPIVAIAIEPRHAAESGLLQGVRKPHDATMAGRRELEN
jgi:hypothetical protein